MRGLRDRRSGERRRRLRRQSDHELLESVRLRTALATVGAICGGLAVLYFFFAWIGAVDMGDALAATVAALALSAVWLVFFVQRARHDAPRVQRPDRERRGF